MDRKEKGAAIVARLGDFPVPSNVPRLLDEALYTMSESGQWPDNVDSVSTEQAMRCWQLVERLKTMDYFPTEFRM